MENIIKELIRIENEAEALIIEAQNNKKHFDEHMREKEIEIRKEIDEQASEQINKIDREAHQESSQKIAEINQMTDYRIASLKKMYEQNRLQWEADIVNYVIGQ